MLRKVEQKTKKGGLFSTSAAHSIIDDADSNDWFSITFSGNSSDFQYTPEEQKQITQDVKRELFDKAMRQFAILNAGSATPPAVPEFISPVPKEVPCNCAGAGTIIVKLDPL